MIDCSTLHLATTPTSCFTEQVNRAVLTQIHVICMSVSFVFCECFNVIWLCAVCCTWICVVLLFYGNPVLKIFLVKLGRHRKQKENLLSLKVPWEKEWSSLTWTKWFCQVRSWSLLTCPSANIIAAVLLSSSPYGCLVLLDGRCLNLWKVGLSGTNVVLCTICLNESKYSSVPLL